MNWLFPAWGRVKSNLLTLGLQGEQPQTSPPQVAEAMFGVALQPFPHSLRQPPSRVDLGDMFRVPGELPQISPRQLAEALFGVAPPPTPTTSALELVSVNSCIRRIH